MRVTVIVCTHNRCQDLADGLNSLTTSILPEGVDWEVLVVDNNSTDQTPGVVKDFSSRFPGRFHYVFEPQPGKSFALNTGIRKACGDVLAFVDDDVTVEPTWLQNLTAALHNNEWAGAGGRTLPAQPFSPPRWMPFFLAGILCAHFDLGDSPCELDRAPYGANMAFRKSMFEKYGGFRTDMGPSPNREVPRPNEDTEFGRRLLAAGERLRYEPFAIAHHPVLEDRLRPEYFLEWWFDFGRATVREVGSRPDIWGIPRAYLSMLKYATVLIPLATLRWLIAFNPQQRFWLKCLVWRRAGDFSELYRRSFGAARLRNNPIEKREGERGS